LDYKIQLKSIEASTILEKVPRDSIGFVLSNLIKEKKDKIFMHITTGNFQSAILKKEIEFFNPDAKILVFENWDTLPYDRSSPKDSTQAERIQTLDEILNYSGDKKVIIITTINAVLQRIMPREVLEKNSIKLKQGQKFTLEELAGFLINAGYKKVNTTISMGEFSANNKVVDVIAEENKCYRIRFYKGHITEIRRFNPVSQISLNELKQINLIPVNEIVFSKEYILNFKQNYKSLFGVPKKEDLLYEAVSNENFHAGLENYLPLFYNNKLETIFDYLPKNMIISIDENIAETKDEKLSLIKQHYQERIKNIKKSLRNGSIYNPIPPELLYLNNKELEEKLTEFICIRISDKAVKDSKVRTMDLELTAGEDFYKESEEKNINVFKELKNLLKKA